MKECYSTFKNICNEYLINYTEFEQIFGELGNEFDLWDLYGHKRIDAVSIFAGATIFCDAKPEAKFYCK